MGSTGGAFGAGEEVKGINSYKIRNNKKTMDLFKINPLSFYYFNLDKTKIS